MMAYTETEEDCERWQEEQFLDFETHEVTCGNACGHFDYLNQCCWLSWWTKHEGDYCNYGLIEVAGEIYTPKELEELRGSCQTTRDEK